MSTELQKQVNSQLRSNELAFLSQRALRVGGRSKKNRVSFLFDTENTEFYARKGVTSDSRVPIFEDIGRLRFLGEQGLLELESLNPRISSEGFGVFFENAEISSIQMLTREEAEERLEGLRRFVDFLVPYFLLDSAKICIEYLIQAYEINVLLGEYLFYSFLPYHDMSEFCQLVRTLEIPEQSEVRGLADSIKSTKTVISSRSHLSFILLRNPVLFRSLVEFWEKRLRTFHLTKNVALTNLVTWLIIEMIEELSRSKDLKNLGVFLECIIEVIVFGVCLRGSQYEDLRSTAYCILYKLSTPLLALSNETQVRMIEELFRSVSRDHKLNAYCSYIPETILLVNHILTQFGALSHFDCFVDIGITQFVLENQRLFAGAFKQLSEWESDFVQVFTLITKSVLSFEAARDHNQHSSNKSSADFVREVLGSLGDGSSLVNEGLSKMVRAIVLVLIDLHPQAECVEEVVQMIHSNYPSELTSALSFSLSVSSSPDSQLFELREKAQSFVDMVLKGDEEERENSRMFLTLLNSQDLSVLDSCLDMITALINKSSGDLKEMTHLERRIFDLSLKHFIGSSSRDAFFDQFSLRILRLPQTVIVSRFLDLEDPSSQWRVSLIFRAILGYLRSWVTTAYPSLSEFIYKETSCALDLSYEGFGIERMIMESIFPQDLTRDSRLADLLKSLVFILEAWDDQSLSDKTVESSLDVILVEYLDTFISVLVLVAHQDLLFPQDLKEVSSRLLSLLNNRSLVVETYIKSILEKPSLNYLEFSFVLLKLKELLCSGIAVSDLVLPNDAFSELGVRFEDLGQIIGFLESLYYKFYYQISSVPKSSHNDARKLTASQTNAVFVLALLRSVFSLVLSKKGREASFEYRLLNIALVDTLDIGALSSHSLVGLPIFQLINLCFGSDRQAKYDRVASLIVSLSRNLFNILSQSHSSESSSVFYGRRNNVYTQVLISHSYSFLEIIISKLPVSEDSFIASNLLENILFSVLVYNIIPALLNHESKSARLASFRLCKAVQDQLKQVIGHAKASASNLKFSDILSAMEKDDGECSRGRLSRTGKFGNSIRSCYLDRLSPSISQVASIIDQLLAHQSTEAAVEIGKERRNFLESVYNRLDQDDDHEKATGTVLILNFVMISEFILHQNRLEEHCHYYNLGFLSDYVARNFNFGSGEYCEYYNILLQLVATISSSFICNAYQEDRLGFESRLVVIGLSFLKQGAGNLVSFFDKNPQVALTYIREVKRLGESCKFFSSLGALARDMFAEILLMIIDEKITRNIKEDDNEFASFAAEIISQIASHSPEKIKQLSLCQYTLNSNSLKRLDLLITHLLESYCNSKENCNTELTEQIVLEWLCYELNLVSLQLSSQSKYYHHSSSIDNFNTIDTDTTSTEYDHEELLFNKELVDQVMRNLRWNNKRLSRAASEDEVLILFRMEIYLIRILEFGVQFRRVVEFKQVKESILDYFDLGLVGVQRKGSKELDLEERVISPRFMLDPMVVSSITSLLSNIRVDESSRSYLRICSTLFSVYDYLVKNASADDLEGRIYVIKSTFYSLSLFVDHSLSTRACIDQLTKERIKGILFNILVGDQIRRVVETRRFHSIGDLLGLMEKLYNDIIYKDGKRPFSRVQGIFIIIKYYLGGGVVFPEEQGQNQEDFSSLMDYMIASKFFETRVQIYNELLASIQREMEVVVNFQDPNGVGHHYYNYNRFETKRIILYNLVLMTRSVIYFLSNTLLSFEVGSSEIRGLVELFDHLVLIKALMSRKIFKKLGALLKANDASSCASTMHQQDADDELRLSIDQLEREYVYVSFGLGVQRGGGKKEDGLVYDNKAVQRDIDSLIQSIMEDSHVKRHLLLSWDLSGGVKFEMPSGLRKRFESLLLDTKVDYWGTILRECLDRKVRISSDGDAGEEGADMMITGTSLLLFSNVQYVLDSLMPDGGGGVADLESQLERRAGSVGLELVARTRKDLRQRLKVWTKSWYVLDLVYRVAPPQTRGWAESSKMVFERIVDFYGRLGVSDVGVVLKVPLIQNFLLERISAIEEKVQGVSILYEVQTILGDAIQTVRRLNESGSDLVGLDDRKVKSLLALGHDKARGGEEGVLESADTSTSTALQLPFMNLINAILSSKVLGMLVVSSSGIRRDILTGILLSDKVVLHYDLFGLTSLLKRGGGAKPRTRSGRNRGGVVDVGGRAKDYGAGTASGSLEDCVTRMVLAYSTLEGSLALKREGEMLSPSRSQSGEDFVGMYSQILKEVSSDMFSRLSKYENFSYYKKNKSRFAQELNSCYARLTSLVLVISCSIHSMDSGEILADKSKFVERFSQLYLLLINLLIINFSKLHLIKKQANVAKDGNKKLSMGRKRTGEEEEEERRNEEEDEQEIKDENEDGERKSEKSLGHFISEALGSDLLSSHVSINPGWLGLNAKTLLGLGSAEADRKSLSVWRLESSISTLLSVFSLKLNAKMLRELVLLIRRLVHRNEESFLSRANEVTKKSSPSSAASSSQDGSAEKRSIREFYEEEVSETGDSDLAKDIYSCRVWVLVLLGVLESTGEYGTCCLLDDIALDIKSMSDLTQMNALTCVQNITISQYRNIKSPNKKRHSKNSHQQITNLNHLDNDFGWHWYHLGIYNLVLIRMIFSHLSSSQRAVKDDFALPSSMQDYLVNPVITNLDMFALFEPKSNQSLSGCGKQWDTILSDIWIHSIKCFQNNDLILASMIKFLANKLRNGNEQVRTFSAQILLKLWKDEVCSISILPHLSDILPTIKELLNDHSEEIIGLTKSVIKIIEERTGEDVFKQL